MRAYRLHLVLAFWVIGAYPATQPHRDVVMFWSMHKEAVSAAVLHVPQNDSARLAQLRAIFAMGDCQGDLEQIQPVDLRHPLTGQNLLCVLPGQIPGTILVIARYEHIGPGMSAVENWTGAMALPLLYYSLHAEPRHHTLVFAEVDGKAGEKALLRASSPLLQKNLLAVVAPDGLGMGRICFHLGRIDNVGSPLPLLHLRALLLSAAVMQQATDKPLERPPGPWLKVDGTAPFRWRGVPGVILYTVPHTLDRIPGSAQDSTRAVDPDAYYDNYRFLCYFVANLDNLASHLGDNDPRWNR